MNRNYTELPNGYMETIQRGIAAVKTSAEDISRSRDTTGAAFAPKGRAATADAIGQAGAGLSTSAGLDHGEALRYILFDFAGNTAPRYVFGQLLPLPGC